MVFKNGTFILKYRKTHSYLCFRFDPNLFGCSNLDVRKYLDSREMKTVLGNKVMKILQVHWKGNSIIDWNC